MQGLAGIHSVLSFQCEDCWIWNLEGRESEPREDKLLWMLIRWVNLDAMCGRSKATIANHVENAIKSICNSLIIGKMPAVMGGRGPLPMMDCAGMGVAVEMLYESISAEGINNPDGSIQFDTMRKIRPTYTLGYTTSPEGLIEFMSVSKGMGKMSLTKCPTQSDFFSWFLSGTEFRMGYELCAARPLASCTIAHLLQMICDEAKSAEPGELRDTLFKVGAAIAVGVAGSLRGNKIFYLDLAGTRELLPRGKNGVIPSQSLAKGTDLSTAPYVHIALLQVNSRERTTSCIT